jgi:glucan biosynthesis protein C
MNIFRGLNDRPAPGQSPDRLFFADNLRTWIIVLVVLHHIALVYGPVAPFYYAEPPPASDLLTYIVVLVFVLFNQAYFMGLLFLVSGHFTPGSLTRKGAKTFVKDRFIRLGIPLVVYFFLLSPLAFLGLYAIPSSLTGITTPPSWQDYPTMIGIGPMWFVELLLIFDIGFAIWWVMRKKRSALQEAPARYPTLEQDTRSRGKSRIWNGSPGEPPRYRNIAVFILLLALTSYLIRIIIPLGKYVAGFPTLSYLPEYISFFIIGIVAVRYNWLRTIPKSMGRVGFVLALVATLTLFPLAFTGGTYFVGNGSWQSAVYALWDSCVAVGMTLGLITLFRDRFNYSGSYSRFLARHSYTVYFIQAPVIVLVAVSLKGLVLPPLAKFALVAFITVPFCFVVAWLVLKIPYADRVL